MQKIEFNKVTWYSKLLAVIVLLIGVPLLSFYIGIQYQNTVEVIHSQKETLEFIQQNKNIDNATKKDDSYICLNAVHGNSPQFKKDLALCESSEAMKAESAMNILYKNIMSKMDYLMKDTQEDARELKEIKDFRQNIILSQQSWLKYMKNECNVQGFPWSSDVEDIPYLTDICKTNLSKARTESLQQVLYQLDL